VRHSVGTAAVQNHSTQSGEAARSMLARPERQLRSSLPTDDPEIREIVQEFVESIPERLDAMSAALDAHEYDELARLAHTLKGCGGTAGFSCFTQPAAQIESSAKAHQLEDIGNRIQELREVEQLIVV
jgi:HPt (histidine-containing phosphotransfer) domain-containing protein